MEDDQPSAETEGTLDVEPRAQLKPVCIAVVDYGEQELIDEVKAAEAWLIPLKPL